MVYDISADPSNPIQIAQVDGLGNVRALTFHIKLLSIQNFRFC